jgi:hypothetical protein
MATAQNGHQGNIPTASTPSHRNSDTRLGHAAEELTVKGRTISAIIGGDAAS